MVCLVREGRAGDSEGSCLWVTVGRGENPTNGMRAGRAGSWRLTGLAWLQIVRTATPLKIAQYIEFQKLDEHLV